MSRDELIAILRDTHGGDYEAAHDNADKALLAYINDPEITAAFRSQTRYTA